MQYALSFENIHKHYSENGGGTVPVFSGLNLDIKAGEHIALAGGSGVGKSTLLRLANRLEDPDKGRVLFEGIPLSEVEVTSHRRAVALVLQLPCLFGGTVTDEVYYSDTLKKKEPDRPRAKMLLELVGIEKNLFTRDTFSLSVGQKQRVCLARALYAYPKVLMMDETTSSLDPSLALKVLGNVIDYAAGNTMSICHVTHEIPKIKMADRMVILGEGKVAEQGPPEKVLSNPASIQGRNFVGK